MTTRQEKVNSLIQKEISQYLSEEKFEGLTGLLTITAVDVSGDLSQAKIYFSSLGQEPAEVLQILHRHIYEIQGVLYEHLKMKKVPRVIFMSDASGEYAGKISKLLKDIDHGHNN